MTDVLITVAEMPAKPATRKTHSIVDTTGKYWDVWPEKIGMFHIGGTYRITDFASREFNGKTYYTIKKVEIPKQQNTDFSPGNIGQPTQVAQPAQQQAAPISQATRNEDISALAILKCMAPLPVGDVAAVENALKTAALAWRGFKKWQGGTGGKIDDEIPY